MSAKRALNQFRAPEEAAAEDRAWAVVRAAGREPVPAARRRSLRLVAIVPALAILACALALTPAGATVGRWISHELGVPHSAPALFSLPARGRVLISGPGGTWIVSPDGSARRLGRWHQASWSPRGRFLAVAGGDELAAVDPFGAPQWTLARPAVSDPRWFPPTGYRVAYLSGAELRVVIGNGNGDHPLAAGVAAVAPAWRPNHAYQLAYLTRRGVLMVRGADSRRVAWSARTGNARALAWSADGARLLVVARARALVYDATGHLTATISMPPHAPVLDGALSPDGRMLALVRGGDASDVVVANLESPGARPRRLFSGAGVRALVWSPDGRWLLVSWPAADQWVFVRVAGRPRIAAVSRIAEQFAARPSRSGFPSLEGWCCTRLAAAG